MYDSPSPRPDWPSDSLLRVGIFLSSLVVLGATVAFLADLAVRERGVGRLGSVTSCWGRGCPALSERSPKVRHLCRKQPKRLEQIGRNQLTIYVEASGGAYG